MAKSKLTAQEVEDKFNAGEDLSDFFTEEVDPATHKPKSIKVSAKLNAEKHLKKVLKKLVDNK
jgi:hypothetical protein